MKTVFLSLMALSLVLGNANAKDTVSTSNKAVVAEKAVPSKSSYDHLLEENRVLREKLEALANESAELKSTVQYNAMMSNMLSKLSESRIEGAVADLESEVAYNEMMGNMFTRIREEEKADAIADHASLDEYNLMMDKMFTKIETEKAADKQADVEAEKAYNQMMANMLLKLKASKS
jgi:hypothetical protein